MSSHKLTDPMPLLYYSEGEKYIYIAPGPAVLVFAIDARIIVRNNLISQKPVLQPETHPFAASCVCTLRDLSVRKALATCELVDETEYEDTLAFWCDFSDAVAERIHAGEEDLPTILDTTWRLSSSTSTASGSPPIEDVGDVELDDEDDSTVIPGVSGHDGGLTDGSSSGSSGSAGPLCGLCKLPKA
jgi:hypothetical protein